MSRYLLDEEGEGRGMTLELNGFGSVGYVTTDPRNVEGMLGGGGGRFDGMFVFLLLLGCWCWGGRE